MWVVYSLDPEIDLKPGDLRRRLIEHARDPEAIKHSLETTEQQTESELERLVLRRLIQAGYRVKTQWPVGAYRLDLVVEGNNKRLAIECDGDRYHTREKLAEDMSRQAILERLGWRFARIRGSEFFRNPDQTMAAIFARLRDMDILPEGAQTGERSTDAAAEELKQRIIRRAAELRREWVEKGEEAASYSGTFASSPRWHRSQPEPTQKPAPAALPTPVELPSQTPKAPPVVSYTPPRAASSALSASTAQLPATPTPTSSSAGEQKKQEFFAGDQVRHSTYGTGTVTIGSAVFSTYRDNYVQVDFGGQIGKKYLNLQKEPLEKISPRAPASQPTLTSSQAAKTAIGTPPQAEQRFRPGDQVRHRTFGLGKVVQSSITSGIEVIQVDFSGRSIDILSPYLEKVQKASHQPATPPANIRQSPLSRAQRQTPNPQFLVGDYAKHPVYGIGRVISNGTRFVEIDFGGQIGTKSFDAELAHLEKVQREAQSTPPANQSRPDQ